MNTAAIRCRFPDARALFFLGLIFSATGILPPAVALLGGVIFGFTTDHPYRREAASLSKLLLQVAVVLLGFGMNLYEVFEVGRSGFFYTACSITFAIGLGLLLGRIFKVGRTASLLISAGTAICGGSAIAALAPVAEASEEEISVSMGTIFLLNAVALLVFPLVGTALHMSQQQFGLWSALAIHDTSSVVGAAAKYGPQALLIGTTVKLARALWIIPVSLVVAMVFRRSESQQKTSLRMPWFIFLFAAAAGISTLFPRFAPFFIAGNHLGKTSLTATLFLIGTGLSRRTLQQVGVRPLLQGIILWIVVAVITATLILRNTIHL